jgi:branched-chain amino acid aminotransferase
MTTRISIDGVLSDESATISVLDRGFLYGDSVYEVMRTYRGRLFARDEHLERLERSALLLEIPLPISKQALIEEIAKTMEAAGNPESYVRVIVTRGAGAIGLDPALATDPARVIIVTALKTIEPKLYQSGVKLGLVQVGRSASGSLPAGAKSGNYLTNLLALRKAREEGAHEALLVDARGRICEGSTSNVFAVYKGFIVTPPLDVGILEGITRRKVMSLAQRIGVVTREEELLPATLLAADEVFITSTIREILPVTRIDESLIGNGTPGAITTRLRQAFAELTA